ncbi:MAG: GNAT family N-acetyltransferase [Candidatus Sumerlaeaceae bacterium]|nr:GNAT family N-acetyltransferase [Candidatus Sumerlaeaceae bacterium]
MMTGNRDTTENQRGGVTVRRATRNDAPTMLALIRALAEYEKLEPPDAAAQERLVRDAFGEKPKFEVYLVEFDGTPVGYAFLLETYSTFLALPTLYIEDIFVLPEYRGKGLGDALFRKCVAVAKERGCGRMEWVTLDWNVSAQDFFKRYGAQHLKEWYFFRLTADKFDQILASGVLPG